MLSEPVLSHEEAVGRRDILLRHWDSGPNVRDMRGWRPGCIAPLYASISGKNDLVLPLGSLRNAKSDKILGSVSICLDPLDTQIVVINMA